MNDSQKTDILVMKQFAMEIFNLYREAEAARPENAALLLSAAQTYVQLCQEERMLRYEDRLPGLYEMHDNLLGEMVRRQNPVQVVEAGADVDEDLYFTCFCGDTYDTEDEMRRCAKVHIG